MIDSYISARLVNYYRIKVSIFAKPQFLQDIKIDLIINGDKIVKLDIISQKFLNGLAIFECAVDKPLVLGNQYSISIDNFDVIPVLMSDVTDFKTFDDDFYYTGKLGAFYTKERTTFNLWAPLASNVTLFIKKFDEQSYQTYKVKRCEKGVYKITLEGDYEKAKYFYRVTNNGLTYRITDPYAFSSSANGKHSYVIDLTKLKKIETYSDKLPTYKKTQNCVIYEINVRDMTIDRDSTIKNKGKYLGLTEEGATTKLGNPAGLDYIEFLNPTHVQIMPIMDFKTIDETDPLNSYNWGYDPQQYFVPEGSYATDPNDPYSRLIEVRKMIGAFHKKGIKVNLDVVFNHVYDFKNSVFEKLVPNFFFRKSQIGEITNGSGCGNELETSRPMVRKLIVDSCEYWIRTYDIDGFRFDLMGLIDIETIKEVYNMAKKIKPDFMIYGEGWDMGKILPKDKRSAIINSFKLPNIAFFNDTYRDILKGPSGSRLRECGYLLGNTSYREGFKFAFLGCAVDYCYKKRFLHYNQSLNYVECHDDMTLYDKITSIYSRDDKKVVNEIIKLINGIICLSFGISFIHAGQEIGATKYYEHNTYNLGDKYNKFDYELLDRNFGMSKSLKSMILTKKEIFNEINTEDFYKNVKFIDLDNGGLAIYNEPFEGLKYSYYLIINPTDSKMRMTLSSYYNFIADSSGVLLNSDIYEQNIVIEGHSFKLFRKEN